MEIALDLARGAGQMGEIPVGALLAAPDGEILAMAANNTETGCDPCGHAEIIALRQACAKTGHSRLPGCVLVSTLEPCLMCAAAALNARIAGLVYGASDSRAGAISSCADLWQLPVPGPRPWHMGGILGSQCAALLQAFFKRLRG